ncbi:hypothetical protein BVX94_01095 [bacterium B17]|nr:hypothetical protein BVX94_01095 [bacterium B17]
MPSPVAHVTLGYVLFRSFRGYYRGSFHPVLTSGWVFFFLCAFLSLLPDIDVGAAVWFSDFGKYHSNLTHSLSAGLVAAVIAGAFIKLFRFMDFRHGFWLALLSYYLHLFLDFFSYGRGIMLLWPFSDQRFGSPATLFLGVRWENGLWAVSHIWTALSEVLFALAHILLYEALRRVFLRRYQSSDL